MPGTTIVLAVTRLGRDRWQPSVQDRMRGPVCHTRLAAQALAEK